MKKSLFRLADAIELSAAYLICFSSNVVLNYAKAAHIDSYILQTFVKSIVDYKTIITLLLTFIAIVFHYQMLSRKKTEIFCRILVGDTILGLRIRYVLNCCTILFLTYLISILVSACLHTGLSGSLCLACIFVVYIIISAGQVR